jgi:hypothetical protein
MVLRRSCNIPDGRLVYVLTRTLGMRRLALVEDVVQATSRRPRKPGRGAVSLKTGRRYRTEAGIFHPTVFAGVDAFIVARGPRPPEVQSGKPMEPIAYIELTDGTTRPVFLNGRQSVIDDDGERVYGDWFIPELEHYDVPIIVGPDVPPFE